MILQATTQDGSIVTFVDESFPTTTQVEEVKDLGKLLLHAAASAFLVVKTNSAETLNHQPQPVEI